MQRIMPFEMLSLAASIATARDGICEILFIAVAGLNDWYLPTGPSPAARGAPSARRARPEDGQ